MKRSSDFFIPENKVKLESAALLSKQFNELKMLSNRFKGKTLV